MSMRPTPDQDLERLLSPDRGEFGGLYDRLARTEPPRRLDRAVLAEASRAVLGRAPRSQRWMLGLGSAAGVVLAAGIAWQVGKQMDQREAPPAAEAGRSSAPQVIPVQPITPRDVRVEPPPAGIAPPAPAAPAAPAAAPKTTGETRARRALQTPDVVAQPAPPPAPVAAQAEVAQPAAEPEAQAFSVDAAARPAERDSSASGAERAEPASDEMLRSKSLGAGKREDRATRVAPAPQTSVQLRNNMQLAPQDWLAEILRLKREGRRQQAIENLRLFQRMHPVWELGDELRALIE